MFINRCSMTKLYFLTRVLNRVTDKLQSDVNQNHLKHCVLHTSIKSYWDDSDFLRE